jgi:hypothetical protein
VRYAYYASDNPLETGSTLASGLNNGCKTDVFDYHKNIGTDFNINKYTFKLATNFKN